jgi:hypothetical protein
MEDLIYILIAVAWIVIGVLGKRKKKAPQPSQQRQEPMPETPPPPKTEIETMFEEIFVGKTPEIVTEEVIQPQNSDFEEYQQPEEYKVDYKGMEYKATSYENMAEAYNVENDYNLTSQQFESLEEMIKKLEREDENRPEVMDLEEAEYSSHKTNVVDDDILAEFARNPKKAILMSEIINKRY